MATFCPATTQCFTTTNGLHTGPKAADSSSLALGSFKCSSHKVNGLLNRSLCGPIFSQNKVMFQEAKMQEPKTRDNIYFVRINPFPEGLKPLGKSVF